MKLKRDEELKLKKLLGPLKDNARVQEMKRYIQHGRVSTYDHVNSVTRLSYWLDQRLHLKSDEKSLIRGAFLHDFYLYDWHKDPDKADGLHGYTHSETALRNASKHFKLNAKEKGIIRSHMWPLNITKVPKSREAWIVCVADKLVSVKETLFNR